MTSINDECIGSRSEIATISGVSMARSDRF